MVKRIAFIGVIFGYVIVALYIALTVGIFELSDTFSYFNLGNFLLFGRYYSVYPLNVSIPEVSHPPLYGLFLLLMSANNHWGMTVISFVQLILVGLSGYLIYLSANVVHKKLGVVAMVLFFLLPYVFPFAVIMMSEVFTIFLVSLYLYLLLKIVSKQLHYPPSLLILVACLLSLTKLVFLSFIPISFIFVLFFEFQKKKHRTFFSTTLRWIPCVVGLLSIVWWMSFVHSHYGQWAMTVINGRILFNGVVSGQKLMPPTDSIAFKKFIYWTGLTSVPTSRYWDIEYSFQNSFNQQKITETQIDDLFRDLAIAAIRQHPASFFFGIFQSTYRDFISPPFHECMLADLGVSGSLCRFKSQTTCRIPWFCTLKGCTSVEQTGMCQPVLKNDVIKSLWVKLIHFSDWYYPFGMMGLLIVTCFGGLMTFVRKSVVGVLITLHCGLLVIGQGSLSISGEGRYTMLSYPFIAVLAANGIREMTSYIRRKTRT